MWNLWDYVPKGLKPKRANSESIEANILCFNGHLVLFVFCLYSQLFGEEDADQEVSPDTADPEAACE